MLSAFEAGGSNGSCYCVFHVMMLFGGKVRLLRILVLVITVLQIIYMIFLHIPYHEGGVSFCLRSWCWFLMSEDMGVTHPILPEVTWGQGHFLFAIFVEATGSCYNRNPEVKERGIVISISVYFM